MTVRDPADADFRAHFATASATKSRPEVGGTSRPSRKTVQIDIPDSALLCKPEKTPTYGYCGCVRQPSDIRPMRWSDEPFLRRQASIARLRHGFSKNEHVLNGLGDAPAGPENTTRPAPMLVWPTSECPFVRWKAHVLSLRPSAAYAGFLR
jgi:hypothetical protein